MATPRTCFATCSLGPPTVPLELKLKAIAGTGYHSIELAFPDLVAFASAQSEHKVADDDYDEIVKAARRVRQLCAEHKLDIFMLQPFANFEGWQEGSSEREDAWKRVRGWTRVMAAAGTQTLQIGSSDSNISFSRAQVVTDLQQLADELEPQGMRIAYENWCWSTHAPRWSDVWEIVKAVDRPNVGLCLDTFQTAGSEWADPTRADGLLDHAGGKAALDGLLDASLAKLAATVPSDKVYILQISDACRVQPPLEDKDVDGLRPRARWSHDHRPPPSNGGYLPVKAVTQAVASTGFVGPYSMEVFEPIAHLEAARTDEETLKVLAEYTSRSMEGMRGLGVGL